MDSILKLLTCPVCIDYCKQAVQCSKCSNLFCKSCSDGLRDRKCALCREVTNFESSIFARRLINNIIVECKFCKVSTTIGDLNIHVQKCKQIPIICKICNDKCVSGQYLNHLSSKHLDEVIDKLNQINLIFEKPLPNR
ncbi:unnamed protein product [Brachionus calyciflorus]|uniref:RING-type domain-containing protein n=1 Tax=Brachionus calyciflorus TaxID=104777 RepID=A0A813P0M4_9BILA|nr:unnamed protein product [Brachionus calyciflorus]